MPHFSLIDWIVISWHKLLIVAIVIDRAWDRIVLFVDKFRNAENYLERRFHERRQTMGDPIETIVQRLEAAVKNLEAQIEGLFTKFHEAAPKIEQAAIDAQKLQQDAKEAVAGTPITPKVI